MRTAFIKQLTEEARNNSKIFLVVGDLGYSVVEEFAQLYPDRFLNVGIAEQNMIGVAAGLAKEGYTVYVYSIGNFPTLRCMEQIRYDVAYHNLDVKIVSVGAGYAYGTLGASHHATEELGMMRTIPNLIVCSPGDPLEAKAITSFSSKHKVPMYLRLGKAGENVVHTVENIDIELGYLLPIIESKSSKNLIIASGAILDYAANFINENKIDSALYSLLFVKPIYEQQILELANKYTYIYILEEHQKSCGIGSAIVEILSDLYSIGKIKKFPYIKRIAINDKFYTISGSQTYLRELAGLLLDKKYFTSE